ARHGRPRSRSRAAAGPARGARPDAVRAAVAANPGPRSPPPAWRRRLPKRSPRAGDPGSWLLLLAAQVGQVVAEDRAGDGAHHEHLEQEARAELAAEHVVQQR